MTKIHIDQEGRKHTYIEKDVVNYKMSLIMPTRKRPEILSQCISNILNRANLENPNFEIIVKVDNDDIETLKWIQDAPKLDYLNFLVSPRRNGYRSLVLASDDMTRMARGEYVFAVADDANFLTEGWNDILENKLTEFKFYFPKSEWPEGQDQSWDTCWAIYPKKVVDIWGEVSPHTLIDMWFKTLGLKAQHPAWGLDIFEKIPEVLVNHIDPNDEADTEKKASDGGDVYKTALYHQQSKECYHYLNLLKEYLINVEYEKIHKHNIVNEYRNNLEE